MHASARPCLVPVCPWIYNEMVCIAFCPCPLSVGIRLTDSPHAVGGALKLVTRIQPVNERFRVKCLHPATAGPGMTGTRVHPLVRTVTMNRDKILNRGQDDEREFIGERPGTGICFPRTIPVFL